MATLMQHLAGRLGFDRFVRLMRFYPPYLGAGVRVVSAAADASRVEVELRLTSWNRNFVGTHFGGSLYAMCDPFFMLMLLTRLGRGYVVWDRSGSIEYLRPGRGSVRAVFELLAARVEEIRRQADAGEKAHPRFEVSVVNEAGETVARVHKTLYVRKKTRVSGARSGGDG